MKINLASSHLCSVHVGRGGGVGGGGRRVGVIRGHTKC